MTKRKVFILGLGSGMILFIVLALGAAIGLHLAPSAEARPSVSYIEREMRILEENTRWMEACLKMAEQTFKRQFGGTATVDKNLVVLMALRLYDTSG